MHGRHLVRAVAVHVNEDVTAQSGGEGIEFQIALRCLRILGAAADFLAILVPVALILLRRHPLLAVAGHVAHAGHGELVFLLTIHALRILAAGHFQTLGGAWKFHALVGHTGHVFQHHRAAADEISRARQNLQSGDAAGEGGAKARIFRPDRMLGPHVRCCRRGHLVTVRRRIHRRSRIHTQVRVHVNQPGRNPKTLAFDYLGIRRRRQPGSDRLDPALHQQHIGVIESRSGSGQHRGAADQRRGALGRVIGGRIKFRTVGCGGAGLVSLSRSRLGHRGRFGAVSFARRRGTPGHEGGQHQTTELAQNGTPRVKPFLLGSTP
jgi:hypothetical protein